jgi:hypothetical protein
MKMGWHSDLGVAFIHQLLNGTEALAIILVSAPQLCHLTIYHSQIVDSIFATTSQMWLTAAIMCQDSWTYRRVRAIFQKFAMPLYR